MPLRLEEGAVDKMEEYNDFLKKSLDLKAARESRHKDVSRDKLFKTAKKKIQTTMIGALSTMEEHFGFLWGMDIPEDERAEEQRKIQELYEDARAKILDRGNTQIRNLELEFVNYDITRKQYLISLPVVTDTNKGDSNE
jgi:transcription termination factor Rho